jgi:hypothetical protein
MCLRELALALAGLLATTAARAYVHERSLKTHAALRWGGGVLTLTLARTAPSEDLSEVEVRRAVVAALAVWDRQSNPCSTVRLRLAEGTTANEVVEDGTSSLSFREERWSRNGDPGVFARYPPNVLARTSLYAKPRPGNPKVAEIVEADIELNAVDFRFTVDGNSSRSPASRTRDLETVLVHEIGHILGLAHNCAMTDAELALKDRRGHVLPPCRAASESLRRSVMFPVGALALTPLLRDLSSDDREALCSLYPRRQLSEQKEVASGKRQRRPEGGLPQTPPFRGGHSVGAVRLSGGHPDPSRESMDTSTILQSERRR